MTARPTADGPEEKKSFFSLFNFPLFKLNLFSGCQSRIEEPPEASFSYLDNKKPKRKNVSQDKIYSMPKKKEEKKETKPKEASKEQTVVKKRKMNKSSSMTNVTEKKTTVKKIIHKEVKPKDSEESPKKISSNKTKDSSNEKEEDEKNVSKFPKDSSKVSLKPKPKPKDLSKFIIKKKNEDLEEDQKEENPKLRSKVKVSKKEEKPEEAKPFEDSFADAPKPAGLNDSFENKSMHEFNLFKAEEELKEDSEEEPDVEFKDLNPFPKYLWLPKNQKISKLINNLQKYPKTYFKVLSECKLFSFNLL
ncbi:MAG: hypothetical protein MJ252_22005 [archaeon]|nr:hypothetical protein [archaeon]